MILEILVFGGGIWLGHKFGYWRGKKKPLPPALNEAAKKLLGK